MQIVSNTYNKFKFLLHCEYITMYSKNAESDTEKRKLFCHIIELNPHQINTMKRKQKNIKTLNFLKLIQNNKNLKFELLITKSYTNKPVQSKILQKIKRTPLFYI